MRLRWKIITTVIVILFIFSIKINAESEAVSISYSTHIQNIGWQSYVKDGAVSGTSGQALRLEAIKINLSNMPVSGGIEYRTHIQNIGWEKEWKQNNSISGTSGQALRLEAIQIRLTGNMANMYDIYYRVHAQNFGWLDWTKNGQKAGTQGYAYRLEAIEIKLVEKGLAAPGSTVQPFKKYVRVPSVNYTTHVQNIGWQSYVKDGIMSGTSGKGLRLEAIKLNLSNMPVAGGLEYRTHIQNIGWEKQWKQNNSISGTSGQALRLEAIQIRLTGNIASMYDIYYRVHGQNFGWLDWAKNGQEAGTQGYAYRLEAIEIKLVEKGGQAPGNTVNPFKKYVKIEYTLKEPIQGIDVSSWQEEIDWNQIKNSGIKFAMIRAGYRGYGISDSDGTDGKLVKDEYLAVNLKNANLEGIDVGLYFFSQAKTVQEAIDEANFVLNMIKDFKITYPIAIDTEYSSSPTRTGRADSLSKDERTKIVKAFCQRIEQAGYKPMVYTGKNFAINNLNMEELSKYDLWIAHYTGATQENPEANKTDYEGSYTMWQFTEDGNVNGINTKVDMNLCYKNYNY